MAKFKAGDFVRCIDAEGRHGLETGKVYKVTNDSCNPDDADSGWVVVEHPDYPESGAHCFDYRFELVEPVFKVGDRVTPTYLNLYNLGKDSLGRNGAMGTVVGYKPKRDLYEVEWDDWSTLHSKANEIELFQKPVQEPVEPTPEEVDVLLQENPNKAEWVLAIVKLGYATMAKTGVKDLQPQALLKAIEMVENVFDSRKKNH